MSLRFDHAIILINDLDQGIAHYKAQGFNPFFGGVHAGGKTHNALIVFADGSYLELLAPTSPSLLTSIDQEDHSSFLFLLAQGEGFGGYALFSDDLEGDVAAMQRRGLAVNLGASNGRARPDGQQLRWRTANLTNGSMTPFFIQDENPRNLRVPDDVTTTAQSNGVRGISGLTIATLDLNDTIHQYEMMTGIKPTSDDYQTAQLSLAGVTLTLSSQTNLTAATKLDDIQLIAKDGSPLSLKTYI